MRRFLAVSALALVAGCGGGGGGGGGGGAPAPQPNQAPVITSPAAATVVENTTGVVYQVAASDPDGNALTYSLGGGDPSDFTISATGAISFVAPPNFEAPADANGDNVYQITVIVSDGLTTANLNLTITVTNAIEGFTVRQVAGAFQAPPVQIAGIPGSNNLFVVLQTGAIRLLDPTVTPAGPGTLFLTVAGVGSPQNSDHGLLAMTTAPDYATSGVFYVSLTNTAGDFEVRRYVRANPAAGDPASADVILRIPHAQVFQDNLGGWMGFGPDGFLYIGVGDRAEPNSAQNLASLQGKLLRIDVASDAFPADPLRDYAIPADNPFAAGAAPEIYAYGFRDPWGGTFNGANLVIGDRYDNIPNHEYNLVRPQDKGGNYGWSLNQPNPPPGVIPPVLLYNGTLLSHSGSPSGGIFYRGPVPQLQGAFVFGDRAEGNIWSVPAANIVQGTTIGESGFTLRTDLYPPGQEDPSVTSFAEDADGNLYYLLRLDQSVYKIAPF